MRVSARATALRILRAGARSAARAAIVARDDKNRVVAGDRPYRFGQTRAIDGERQRLRLAGAGAEDDQLPDAFDLLQEFSGGVLERGVRGRRIRAVGAGALIGAVAGALDETEHLDVAGDRGLCRVDAALAQTPPQLLLTVERLAIDEFENETLSSGFHTADDQDTRLMHRSPLKSPADECISILSYA
jgi:hypothetical protein